MTGPLLPALNLPNYLFVRRLASIIDEAKSPRSGARLLAVLIDKEGEPDDVHSFS